MASLIPGYEYDIFISYRQKDNKGDKWVSRFIDSLKSELEATFKEDVSVYFDENPHDRLQETHNVSKSLEGKLKCLIFIPVLSQTFCDPNCYAWKYEFLSFNKLAREDRFGIDVRLRNGNISSRILPVRIHDLEQEDIKVFEKETGSVLRSLDFVFKTATGVNRPLKPDEDHPHDNLAKTYYSDQINKVARAIKEIVQGLQADIEPSGKEKSMVGKSLPEEREKRVIDRWGEFFRISGRKWMVISSVLLMVLVLGSIFAFPGLFKRDKLDKLKSSDGKISIAVMPFQNMTNDTTRNDWQDWIQNILITSLSNSEQLKVRRSESMYTYMHSKGLTDYASITPSIASKISRNFDAGIFICGSVIKEGSNIRINAQIIDSKTEEVSKSFQINGSAESILHVIDSLSSMVKNFLDISQLKQEKLLAYAQLVTTSSPEAYSFYISGQEAFWKQEYGLARERFMESIRIDSNFTLASLMLSVACLNLGYVKQGKENIQSVYSKRDQLPEYMKCKCDDIYAWYTEGPQGRIKYLKQMLELDDQDPSTYSSLGNSYRLTGQYDKAIPEFEKALEIFEKWEMKPPLGYFNLYLGMSYHETGEYDKERKIYRLAEEYYPGNVNIIYRQAILSLAEDNSTEANKYIEKYIAMSRDNSTPEVRILTNLAGIYSEAEKLDESEKYYRQALSLEPENVNRMNNLAYFLIEKDRNINEGLELIERSLISQPSGYNLLHTKGMGLFKQGKYREALDALQKSWDLRMQNAVFNHDAYLHLQEAKKAAALQK